MPKNGVVEVFADVGCPFTHVGLRRFGQRRALLARDDLVLRVRAWPLELVNATPLDPESVARHVAELREQVAPEMFAGFDANAFPKSTLPALALAAAAYRVGDRVGERVSLALRDALFEAGRDVGDPEVLRAIAAEQEIELTVPGSADAVLADWREGRRRGVRGSPEFFVDGRGYFCPALDISGIDGQLQIIPDVDGFETFLSACFGDPRSTLDFTGSVTDPA
jgi:predicted DsbA family dithiol-disulfide isomerase